MADARAVGGGTGIGSVRGCGERLLAGAGADHVSACGSGTGGAGRNQSLAEITRSGSGRGIVITSELACLANAILSFCLTSLVWRPVSSCHMPVSVFCSATA